MKFWSACGGAAAAPSAGGEKIYEAEAVVGWAVRVVRSLFCFFALEKKGGKKTTTVKRLCKDSCFVFLSTPSNSSPCPCLTLHCSCPQNNTAAKLPALTHSVTHSRLPTSPSSERRTCIYSKPIFPTILAHMHCALDELWLAIITLLSILPVKSVFFFFFCTDSLFCFPQTLLFHWAPTKTNNKTVENVPGAQHPDVRGVHLTSHLCVFHVKPFECRARESTAYGRGLHFWTFAHPVRACVLFMTKMLWA